MDHFDLRPVQRKMFWITFTLFALIADSMLPPSSALGAMIPICFAPSFAYQSDWALAERAYRSTPHTFNRKDP